jgi:hypothetical protein
VDASSAVPGDPPASAPILFGAPSTGSSLLPWTWAIARLSLAKNYWISTNRPDGRPHTRPVWGVWLDNSLWFSTGSLARHNLVGNAAISVNLEDGDAAVIIEGTARPAIAAGELRRMCEHYGSKYDWPMHPTAVGIEDSDGSGGPVFRVFPQVVFGWESNLHAPTRWRFDYVGPSHP